MICLTFLTTLFALLMLFLEYYGQIEYFVRCFVYPATIHKGSLTSIVYKSALERLKRGSFKF